MPRFVLWIACAALLVPCLPLEAASRGTEVEISRLLGRLRKEPANPKVLTELGAQFALRASEQGMPTDVEDARGYLRKALQLQPGKPEALAWIGALRCIEAKVRQTRGYVKQGLNQLDEAVNAAPENLVVRMVRGSVNLEVPREFHRLDMGVEDLEMVNAVAERDPASLVPLSLDAAEVHLKLGRAYRAKGDLEGASRMWQRVLAGRASQKDRETAQKLLQKYGLAAAAAH